MPGDSSSYSPRLVSSSINNNKSYRTPMQKSFAGSRTQQNRARLETSKISGPKPLNLPSLRREHESTPTVLSGSSWRMTNNEHHRRDSSPRTLPSNDSKHSTPTTNIRAWASIVQAQSNSAAEEDTSQAAPPTLAGDTREKGDQLSKTEDEDKAEERNWDEMSDESIDFSVDVLEFADGAVKIDKRGDDKAPVDPWKRAFTSNLPSRDGNALQSPDTSASKSITKPLALNSPDALSSLPSDNQPEKNSKETLNGGKGESTPLYTKNTRTECATLADSEKITLTYGAKSNNPEHMVKSNWPEKEIVDGDEEKRNATRDLSWRRRISTDKCTATPEKFENQYPHRSINTGEYHSGLDWRSSYVSGKPRAAGQNTRNRGDFDRIEPDFKREDKWVHQSEESSLYDQDSDKREGCEPRDRMKYFQGENRRTSRFNPAYEKTPEKKGPSISDIDKIMSSIKRELSAKGTSIEEMKNNVSRGPNAPSEAIPLSSEREGVGHSDEKFVEKNEASHSPEDPKPDLLKDPSYSSTLTSQKSPTLLHPNSTHIPKAASTEQGNMRSTKNPRPSSSETPLDMSRKWDSEKTASQPFVENISKVITNSEASSLRTQDKFTVKTKSDTIPSQLYAGGTQIRNESSFFSGKHEVDETIRDRLGMNSTDEPVDPSLLHRKDPAKNWIGKERKLQFYSNRPDSSIEIGHSAPFTFGKKYLFSSSQDEEVLGGRSKTSSKPSPIGEKRGMLTFGINLTDGSGPPEGSFRNASKSSGQFLEKNEDKQSSKGTSALKKHTMLNQSCNVFPKEFESIADKLGSVGFMVASEIISEDEKLPSNDNKGLITSSGKQKTISPNKSKIRPGDGSSESRITNWSGLAKSDDRKAPTNDSLQDKSKTSWTNEKSITMDNSNAQNVLDTSPDNSKISKSTPLKDRDLGYNSFSKAPSGKSSFMYTPLPQEMGSPTLWVKPHPGLRMAQGESGSIGVSQVPVLPPLMDPSQVVPPRSPQQPVNTQYVQFVPLAMSPHQFMPPYANLPFAPYPQMNMAMEDMNQAGWVMQPVPSVPMGQYHSIPNNPNYPNSLQNKRGHHHHERSPQQSFQRTPPYQNQYRPLNQNFSYSQQPSYSSKIPDPINASASPRLPNTNIPPHFQRPTSLLASNVPPNYPMYKSDVEGIQRNANQSHPRHMNQRGRGAHTWSGVNQRPSNLNYPASFVSNQRGNGRNIY